jgi:FkbM family methyltransferase
MIDSVLKYFKPNSVLDIGANIGEFYLNSKKVLPNSYYYLIEPNIECEEILKTLNVDYYLGAVSDKIEEKDFFVSKSYFRCTGNSLYREITSYFDEKNLIKYKIKTTTLNELFYKNETYFDLIKIDTQGSELDILKGGIEIIKRAKGVILEVAVAEYNLNAPMAEEVFGFMEKLGFEKKEKVGSNNNPETGELVHEDYLFINKN